jgi:SAM-dependent methyltransferase
MSDAGSSPRSPSVLGTHAHWEAAYAAELAALADVGDEGEIWFGAGVEKKTVALAVQVCPPTGAARVLDVGTGNAAMLLALAAAGYADLTGSDYSDAGLELAAAVAAKRGVRTARAAAAEARSVAAAAAPAPASPHITLVKDDATDSKLPGASFDLITDKGTLDAIALSSAGAAAAAAYIRCAARLLAPDGAFVVTSANATLDELTALVEGATSQEGEDVVPRLTYSDHVRDYPSFSFGGRVGTRVATAAFKRQ